VLLAEDDDQLRRLTAVMLQQAGFTVLEANNGRHAVDLAMEHVGRIDLLMVDAVMPELSGKLAAEFVVEQHPETAVLLTSGYPDQLADESVSQSVTFHLIPKPYSEKGLLQLIGGILAGAAGRGGL
jgi:two-component system, cell cycle sensor histidine kinase and response regulator CckA